MKIYPLSIISLIIISGCVFSEKADTKTEPAPYQLPKKTYVQIKGVVVQVEEHPVSPISSSGIRAITYHVEYKLDGSLSPVPLFIKKGQVLEPKKYIIPVTERGIEPRFKTGDEVDFSINIEKSANKKDVSNPSPPDR